MAFQGAWSVQCDQAPAANMTMIFPEMRGMANGHIVPHFLPFVYGIVIGASWIKSISVMIEKQTALVICRSSGWLILA